MFGRYYLLETAGISILFVNLVMAFIKIKHLSKEIENIRLEQEKMNFRLFVYEKTQKLLDDRKIS